MALGVNRPVGLVDMDLQRELNFGALQNELSVRERITDVAGEHGRRNARLGG